MYDNYRGRDEKEREKAASVLVPVAVGLTSGAFRLAGLSISNLDNCWSGFPSPLAPSKRE